MENKLLLVLLFFFIYRFSRAQNVTDQDDQSNPCGPNEVSVTCPEDCPADYCPTSAEQDQTCPEQNCDQNATACKCRLNYRRDKEGKCISTKDCPPFDCSAYPNEEYDPCQPICPTDSCADVKYNGTCPYHIDIILICNPKCSCKEGFARNDDGICVRKACCPQNGETTKK